MAADPTTIAALQAKHPKAPTEPLELADIDDIQPLVVDEETVRKAVNTMSPGSSGGTDGLRPIIMQQLLSTATVECGSRLLSALTKLINKILAGKMPDYAIPSLFGASLCTFQKPDGGIRPIAVGSFYRRLACRIAAQHGSNLLSAELSPTQPGVGTRGGCEAAVHTFRYFSTAKARNTDNPLI